LLGHRAAGEWAKAQESAVEKERIVQREEDDRDKNAKRSEKSRKEEKKKGSKATGRFLLFFILLFFIYTYSVSPLHPAFRFLTASLPNPNLYIWHPPPRCIQVLHLDHRPPLPVRLRADHLPLVRQQGDTSVIPSHCIAPKPITPNPSICPWAPTPSSCFLRRAK